MKYTTETALEEIIRRSESIKERKSAGLSVLLTTVSGALAFALCFVCSLFVRTSSSGIVFPQYGALMMDELAGGYVLCTLVSLSIACAVTVAVYRKIKEKRDRT